MSEKQSGLEDNVNEQTLVICKPESIVLGDYAEILWRIQRARFATPLIKMISFTQESAEAFYCVHSERIFYKAAVESIAGKPSLAVIVKGPNSTMKIRNLVGATYPSEALPGSIRGDLSSASPAAINYRDLKKFIGNLKTFIASSDSPEEATRQIAVLKKYGHIDDKDFFDYEHHDWSVLYPKK